jgi:hypothetical protein
MAACGEPGRPEFKGCRFRTPVENAIYLLGTSATRPPGQAWSCDGETQPEAAWPRPTPGPLPRPSLDTGGSRLPRHRQALRHTGTGRAVIRACAAATVTEAAAGQWASLAQGKGRILPVGLRESSSLLCTHLKSTPSLKPKFSSS